jgi:hypothetical protein
MTNEKENGLITPTLISIVTNHHIDGKKMISGEARNIFLEEGIDPNIVDHIMNEFMKIDNEGDRSQ